MKTHILIFAFFIIVTGCETINKPLPTSDPILILTADNGQYGEYTAEILKTEGFNEFQMVPFSDTCIKFEFLNRFDIVILGEMLLTGQQQKLLERFVKKGGNLITFRPDKKLSKMLGINPLGDTMSEGYIGVNTNSEIGKGISTETLQFHGTADLYTLNGADGVAELFPESGKVNGLPAVVVNKHGKGKTIAFTYNLPKNIVYTRQGNPEHAGLEKDGILGIRGMDLFTDGWVDTSKNTLNQADEHMHLFSHCLEYMSKSIRPLPRFWYFPDSLNCLIVLDNDGEDNGEEQFENQFRDIDSMGARMTLYIKDVSKVSKEWVNKWLDRGHEFSTHPDDTEEAENPTWNRMDSILGDIKQQVETTYGLIPRTIVNHWFVWCGRNADGTPDFAAQARLGQKHGFEMDANYAHYNFGSPQGDFLGVPGFNQGNYNGSGLVMKYADIKGNTVNVFQRFNAVYDQEYMDRKDPEGFFDCFKGLVDRSMSGNAYSIVSIKAHNTMYHFSRNPILKMLAYANEKGIPVWTALNLLDFLKMKDEATFQEVDWTGHWLSFRINSAIKHSHGLSFMLPVNYCGKKINYITIDAQYTPFKVKLVKGREYAFITLEPGKKYKVLARYENGQQALNQGRNRNVYSQP